MQVRSSSNARGIDVSHWQGVINWQQVRAEGHVFAFIKASEGKSVKDKKFIANVQGATMAGLLVGAYHFSRAASPADVKAEVDYFLTVTDPVEDSMKLPFVLDIETNEAGSRTNTVKTVRAWVDYFKQRTGIFPMIYTFPNFIDTSLDDSSFRDIKLWYAYYNKDSSPNDRGGWKEWEFLQYSSSGTVKGISGNVDMNEYKGSEAQLRAAYDPKTTIPSEPPEVEPKPPQWKETGKQWLVDQLGISEDWKSTDTLDVGTLGTILARYANKFGK
ncbi:glycoside hydrolase family 25 protein [Paenibacillus sp. IHBB 10380]|uniref:glycoside hydrolase family 25 protein n=1 Tax=Paenibacillus sp. IHBB 10380 TaxID=1566358 RepID=UPI0006978636|nr:glycoside hydrolase family 25 protein [Paenibacillus sp. IHBB 10380]